MALSLCTRTARVRIDTPEGDFGLVVRRISVEERAQLRDLLDELGKATKAAGSDEDAEVPAELVARVRESLAGMIDAVEGLELDGDAVTAYDDLAARVEQYDPVAWPVLFWTLWSAAVGVQTTGGPLSQASVSTPATAPGSPATTGSTAPDAPPPDDATTTAPTPGTDAR